jgi:hypothetical protein
MRCDIGDDEWGEESVDNETIVPYNFPQTKGAFIVGTPNFDVS